MSHEQLIPQLIFGAALALVFYTYVGYPLTILLLSRLFPWPVTRRPITPRVSVIIAAHNEEHDIAAKLENTLSLDYPKDTYEIIVASDCSTDRTDEIVRSYTDLGVILHRQTDRLGKTVAQSQAVALSSGEILVFSDATTHYAPDALRKIVRSFADPRVGAVAGQLVYVDSKISGVGQGCRSYWDYEKRLKRRESRLGTLIGVSGCLYAVRRSCHGRLANDMIDDFVIALEIHRQGLRTVYEPEAIAMEDTNRRTRDEFRMRVRVIEQTMSALSRYRDLLNPRRHRMFAFQMLSHKALRYLMPVLLVALFASNVLLLHTAPLFDLAFLAQVGFYAIAFIGMVLEKCRLKIGPLALPYYFVMFNLATIAAFLRFMRGETHSVWQPIRGTR